MHRAIHDKPVRFDPSYSKDWEAFTGELLDLQNHVSAGGAFIPALMTSTRRSSAAFKSSELAVVDVDHGLTIADFRAHPLAQHACWLYTTCSHSENEHRFRVCFRLPHAISSAEVYKALTTILIRSIGGDRACSDACRLYYGNSEATHPIWQPKAVLSEEIIEQAKQEAEINRARFDAATAEFEADDILRAIFCLEEIIEPTRDGEREPKFLPITMAANRVGGAIFAAWSDWSFRGYHGKKNGQASERYFQSSRSSKHTLGTIFHHANQDDPNWRDKLPDELKPRGEYNPAAGRCVAGYEHSEFLGDDDLIDLTYEMYVEARTANRTQTIFDVDKPWTFNPDDAPELPDDGEPEIEIKRGPGRPRLNKEAPEIAVFDAIKATFADLRYNLTSGGYEHGPITDPQQLSNDQIERAYLEIAWGGNGSFNKTLVKDSICTIAETNNYSPVASYLNHCAANAKPIDYFSSLASTLLGSPKEGTSNPRLESGQLLHDAILQRFFVGAVARALEPGCTHDWMPILVGSQACGKTSFLQYITPPNPETNRYEWTATIQQDLTALSNRPHKLHAGWIVVLDECERYFGRKNVEQLKNLVSTSVDRSDPKYRNEMNFARTFVLAGACNNSDFLTDPTGNRRFMPLIIEGKIGTNQARKVIDLDRVKRDRDGIWAAAFRTYQDNPVHCFDTSELAQISGYVNNFNQDNPLENLVLNNLAGRISGQFFDGEKKTSFWSVSDIMSWLDVPVYQQPQMTKNVTDVLKRHGYTKKRHKRDGFRNLTWVWYKGS